METQEIRLLYRMLQNSSRWFIDPSSPDIELFQTIAEKAKSYADKRLTRMWFIFFWLRYQKWKRSERLIPPKEDYYESFLNDLVFDLGFSGLKGQERDWFSECCNLTLKFI